VSQLQEVLSSADPQTPTWTFGPKPRLVEFWIRRQALETIVHLWDAQGAVGIRRTTDVDLALDGVDEVVTMFYPREVRLGRALPLAQAVSLNVSDVVGTSFVIASDLSFDMQPPAATVTGTSSELLRLVWGRIELDELHVDGDSIAIDTLMTTHLTP
jgi:uncharacterized protein (TIGR03083 family)